MQASSTRIEERLCNWAQERRLGQDPDDAMRVEQAWRRLNTPHKELLRMVYVWGANREVICRRLKIARHPRVVLELELAGAKRAIEKILNE